MRDELYAKYNDNNPRIRLIRSTLYIIFLLLLELSLIVEVAMRLKTEIAGEQG